MRVNDNNAVPGPPRSPGCDSFDVTAHVHWVRVEICIND